MMFLKYPAVDSGVWIREECYEYAQDFYVKPDWKNFDVTSINREPAHTRWGAYESEKQAVGGNLRFL
jgi:hypothetical protein